MHDPVEYCVRQSRFTEVGVPGLHWELATYDGRPRIDTIVEDFEQVGAVLGGECDKPPVIQYQYWRLGESFEQLQITAIAVRGADFLEQAGDAPVSGRTTLAARLMSKSARDPCLSRPGRSGH